MWTVRGRILTVVEPQCLLGTQLQLSCMKSLNAGKNPEINLFKCDSPSAGALQPVRRR